MSTLHDFLGDHFGIAFIMIAVLSILMPIIYFIVTVYLISKMDPHYFLHRPVTRKDKTVSGSILSLLKNFLGIALIVSGTVMLVLPGQGILTILIGLALTHFPGKRSLEQTILKAESTRQSLNWIRKKANKKPFVFPSS